MGTEIATLLSAVPNTNWVNATFSWITSKGQFLDRTPAKPGTRAVSVLFSQRAASFQLPGGVLILAHPEKDGGNEVNQ